MREVMGTARNIFALAKGGETSAMVEVAIVTTEPTFKADDSSGMVRARSAETVRFVASADALRQLAAEFTEWATEADQVLGLIGAKVGSKKAKPRAKPMPKTT